MRIEPHPALTLNKTIVSENVIDKPTSLANLSMGLSKQIEVIMSIQDFYITEKLSLVRILNNDMKFINFNDYEPSKKLADFQNIRIHL